MFEKSRKLKVFRDFIGTEGTPYKYIVLIRLSVDNFIIFITSGDDNLNLIYVKRVKSKRRFENHISPISNRL